MASHSSVEAIAGFSAGVLTALITHPLEIVKTRLQREYLPAYLLHLISFPSPIKGEKISADDFGLATGS
jgi:hypothetical protein